MRILQNKRSMAKKDKNLPPKFPSTFKEWAETIFWLVFIFLFVVYFPQIASFIVGVLKFIGGENAN